MPTQASTVDFLLDQLRLAGPVQTRKMFGEYALYYEEKVVALICDNQLFMKPSDISEKFLSLADHGAPPYPGAKNYLLVPEDRWEDTEWLCSFVEKTAAALPPAKPKKIRKQKQSRVSETRG